MKKTSLHVKINKAQDDIESLTSQLREICKVSGLGELCFFLHAIHFSRRNFQENKLKDDSVLRSSHNVRQINDLSKYLVQLIWKFGKHGFLKQEDGSFINMRNVNLMHELAQRSILNQNLSILVFS